MIRLALRFDDPSATSDCARHNALVTRWYRILGPKKKPWTPPSPS